MTKEDRLEAIRDRLGSCRVVRLNTKLFPIRRLEGELFHRYNVGPVAVETDEPAELIAHLADCDALFAISANLPEAVVDSLSKCRVISRLGAGTDKIDVAAATRKGILVTNVPYFCVEEQADHTMALLLSLERKLPQMSQAMAEGAWSRSKDQARSNHRLPGRVLGLVGFGRSAQAVARRARGFGINVIATRRRMDAPRDEADALGVTMVPFDQLVADADYVSLHLPLGADNYHMFDGAVLATMKPGAYLINTSRGALVDETALVEALRTGALGGAGLDTFEQIDPFTEVEAPPTHPLLSLDNVILTPHIAATSVESGDDVSRGGVENVVSILCGHMPDPENIVNPKVVPRDPLAEHDPSLFQASG